MILNKEMIRKFCSGSIVIRYEGNNLANLRNVLKHAYPNTKELASGNSKYYISLTSGWTGTNKTDKESFTPEEFFTEYINDFPREIVQCKNKIIKTKFRIIGAFIDNNKLMYRLFCDEDKSLNRSVEASKLLRYYYVVGEY